MTVKMSILNPTLNTIRTFQITTNKVMKKVMKLCCIFIPRIGETCEYL